MDVHFDVTHPFHIADTQPSVEEIGAGIMVMFSWTQYYDRLTIGSGQPGSKHLMLPDVVQESLGH